MIDEYEIKLSQKHKRFNDIEPQSENERRANSERRRINSLRRTLMDRRQQTLRVEHERRKEQRRISERRSFQERRVTSDYSQERLEEERERLKSKNPQDMASYFLGLAFLIIVASFFYLFLQETDRIQ